MKMVTKDTHTYLVRYLLWIRLLTNIISDMVSDDEPSLANARLSRTMQQYDTVRNVLMMPSIVIMYNHGVAQPGNT